MVCGGIQLGPRYGLYTEIVSPKFGAFLPGYRE